MTGAERPPYLAFQARFSPASDHFSGRPFSREMPSRSGPRQSGQSPTEPICWAKMADENEIRSIEERDSIGGIPTDRGRFPRYNSRASAVKQGLELWRCDISDGYLIAFGWYATRRRRKRTDGSSRSSVPRGGVCRRPTSVFRRNGS